MWRSILEISIRSSAQMGRNKAIVHLNCVSELKRNSGWECSWMLLATYDYHEAPVLSFNLDVYAIDGGK